MEAAVDGKLTEKESNHGRLSKRVKRKIKTLVSSESDCCPSANKRANLCTDSKVLPRPATAGVHFAASTYSLPQLPYISSHCMASLPLLPYLNTCPPAFNPSPGLLPPPVITSYQPAAWNTCSPASPVGIGVPALQPAGCTEAVRLPGDQSTVQLGDICASCRGKDELIDVQQNMICHLQHVVAVARNSLPAMQNVESNYMRVSVRQGRIPRHIAGRNGMFEIQIPAHYQSGVFISPSLKYDLEINHSERGTLIAKKLLQAFFTEYDLAYAGGLLALKGRPGIDPIVLAVIESFSASRGKSCADRPAIRSSLSAEIASARKARELKGLKVFQRDRLLENPNNVPPTPAMDFVVSDIRQILFSTSNSAATNLKSSHLRHPNVLLLMATCATDNMEGLVLIFERIYFGSLYNYLHEKSQQPAPHSIVEAGLQLCEGLIFIHQNNFIHNYISSHSVFLTSCNTLKIGNFEYMVPMTIGGKASRHSGIVNNKYLNATYNWLPPEVMKGELSTEKSDIYSFCAVMWEMFTGYIPWAGHDAEQIEKQVCNQKMLKVNDSHVPAKFVDVLTYGLQPGLSNRKMNLEQIRDVLTLLPRGRAAKSDKSPTGPIQTNNHCSSDYEPLAFSMDKSPLFYYSVKRRTSQSKKTVKSFEEHTRGWETLKCNHATQTCEEDRWLERGVDENNNVPCANQSHSVHVYEDISSRSHVHGASSELPPHSLEDSVRLRLALKAPVHAELVTYYAEHSRKRAAASSTPSTIKPEDLLSPQQICLQKQLNVELREILFKRDKGVSEQTGSDRTITSRSKSLPPAGEGKVKDSWSPLGDVQPTTSAKSKGKSAARKSRSQASTIGSAPKLKSALKKTSSSVSQISSTGTASNGAGSFLLKRGCGPTLFEQLALSGGRSDVVEDTCVGASEIIKAAGVPSAKPQSALWTVSSSTCYSSTCSPLSYEGRSEPYQMLASFNKSQSQKEGEGSCGSFPDYSGSNSLMSWLKPSSESGEERLALRYLNKNAAITEQVPVVERVKALNKLYGQRQTSARAKKLWLESSQCYEQSEGTSISVTPRVRASHATQATGDSTCSSETAICSLPLLNCKVLEKKKLFEKGGNTSQHGCQSPAIGKTKKDGTKAVQRLGVSASAGAAIHATPHIRRNDRPGKERTAGTRVVAAGERTTPSLRSRWTELRTGSAAVTAEQSGLAALKSPTATCVVSDGRTEPHAGAPAVAAGDLTDSPALHASLPVMIESVKSYVSRLERSSSADSKGRGQQSSLKSAVGRAADAVCSSQSPGKGKTTTVRSSGKGETTTVCSSGKGKTITSVREVEQTSVPADIDSVIASFQRLTSMHERRQADWRKYSGRRPAGQPSAASHQELTGRPTALSPDGEELTRVELVSELLSPPELSLSAVVQSDPIAGLPAATHGADVGKSCDPCVDLEEGQAIVNACSTASASSSDASGDDRAACPGAGNSHTPVIPTVSLLDSGKLSAEYKRFPWADESLSSFASDEIEPRTGTCPESLPGDCESGSNRELSAPGVTYRVTSHFLSADQTRCERIEIVSNGSSMHLNGSATGTDLPLQTEISDNEEGFTISSRCETPNYTLEVRASTSCQDNCSLTIHSVQAELSTPCSSAEDCNGHTSTDISEEGVLHLSAQPAFLLVDENNNDIKPDMNVSPSLPLQQERRVSSESRCSGATEYLDLPVSLCADLQDAALSA